jgi:low temperature requirement protein LtrA
LLLVLAGFLEGNERVAVWVVALAIDYLGPVALAALALVSAVCSVVVAYEVLRYREARIRVRHPELAAGPEPAISVA